MMMILTISSLTGCGVVMAPPVIPKGHVEIYVEFKGFSSADYNTLNSLIQSLPEEHSVFLGGSDTIRDVGDFQSQIGILNSGSASQIYNPNHPVPSPDVEAAIQARLKKLLKENKVDPTKIKIQFRYGQTQSVDSEKTDL
ncbi:MAG: hypothetical protein AAF492_21770 [Verrucomicrobiota bacterium]